MLRCFSPRVDHFVAESAVLDGVAWSMWSRVCVPSVCAYGVSVGFRELVGVSPCLCGPGLDVTSRPGPEPLISG